MRRIISYAIFFFACNFFIPDFCAAQMSQPVQTPDGSTLIFQFESEVAELHSTLLISVVATNKKVGYRINFFKGFAPLFEAPDGVDIEAVGVKRNLVNNSNRATLIIFLSNETVCRYDLDSAGSSTYHPASMHIDYTDITKSYGDRLYAVSQTSYPNTFIASDDTARTWFTDSAGISNLHVNDFDVDTLNNVWLATNQGLYFQTEGGAWTKITANPDPFINHVFVDKSQRIITSSNQHIYISTNHGSTWTIDTSGLNNRYINNLGGDVYGNLYAIASTFSSFGNGNAVLKSAGGTGAWASVASSISNKTRPIDLGIFTSLSGDSSLLLSTSYGLFASTDQAATWQEDNEGIQSENNIAFLETNAGRKFMSTGLGVFYKDKTDSAWTHCFPSYGYVQGGTICKDDAGNIYTLGENIKSVIDPVRQYVNYKSTDNGITWLADSLGLSNISNGIYYVDETGVQHAADLSGGGFFTDRIYVKPNGQPWQFDTIGIIISQQNFASPSAFYSDHSGNLYLAFENSLLYKRPISGGTWMLDTAGLTAPVFSFTKTKTGILLAGSSNGIKEKTGNVWHDLPQPAGNTSLACFFLSVDSSNTIIAGFSYPNGFNYIGYGVYWSKDMGTTWNSFNLDTITFKQFVSVNDTTYGLSYGEGAYAFTPAGVLAQNLTDIIAYKQGAAIEVKWDIVTETNNDKYAVERSADGRQFNNIGFVTAQEKTTYSWLDASPFNGDNYYRIKILDKNGIATYSSVVKVNLSSIQAELKVFPNPVKENIVTVQIINMLTGNYILSMYIQNGQLVFSKNISYSGGSESIAIPVNNLSKGLYHVQLKGQQQIFNQKLIIQ